MSSREDYKPSTVWQRLDKGSPANEVEGTTTVLSLENGCVPRPETSFGFFPTDDSWGCGYEQG